MANTPKNVQKEKNDAAEIVSETKPDATAAAESAPVNAPKKRGRKPKAQTEAAKTPAAKTDEKAPAASKSEKAPAAKTANANIEKASSSAPKKRGRKPKAETEAAKTTSTASKTPAAKSSSAKTAASKTASDAPKKRGRKPKAQTETAKSQNTAAPAKRGGRKKTVTYDSVISAAKKKFSTADISKIKDPIAVNIEMTGSATGIFYVVLNNKDGKNEIKVEPYKYDDFDVYLVSDADKLINVLNDKKNVYDALADGEITFGGHGQVNLKKTILFFNSAF